MGWARGVMLAALLGCWPEAHAAEPGCAKAEFEAVVAEAAGRLRELALVNRPVADTRLRELKSKRGWGDAAFLAAAGPLVNDARTAELDRASQELLERMRAASEGEGTATADCSLLSSLRDKLASVVAMQTEKWAHIRDNIEEALRK
jgi:hypothetical protein